MALWDLSGKIAGKSFGSQIGAAKARVEVGVSIGIQENAQDMLEQISGYLEAGYQRIKVKIAPGADLQVLETIRGEYPDLKLWVDANAAYTLEEIDTLRKLDSFDLGLIEQPLQEDDLVDHAELQRQVSTSICLDESIHHLTGARHAIELGSCRVINIKPARVGGLLMATEIEAYCKQRGVPVWCGGMLETGIGRAANLALAAREGFTLPGDLSASDRYYEQDICDPPFKLNADSTIDVPSGPGLGVHIDEGAIKALSLNKDVLLPD
jgi:O-succinylbenzoate synthase